MEGICYLCALFFNPLSYIKVTEINFTKMQGAGNDYIYIDCSSSPAPDRLTELAIAMSDRHFGVGGDGIVLILPSDVADFRMRMFNADGSEAQMCGNATRCIGKYVYDRGLTGGRTVITLETLAGIKTLDLHPGPDGKIASVTVDMGAPILDCASIPVVPQGSDTFINKPMATSRGPVEVTAVSMGNPHGVVFTDGELTDDLIHGLGREMETLPDWPEKANIEFARVTGPEDIEMRVWERGSGETLACGTGACATAVAAALTGRAGRRVNIHLLGGTLNIEWRVTDSHVMMTGPAVTVFTGTYLRR